MFFSWMALLAALSPWKPEADQCPFCLACFQRRDSAPVVVKTQCCGRLFDLDCVSKWFIDQPIGSRRCAMCRQNPMPLVNLNTSESHPDTFFPDQTFFRACLDGDLEQVERSLAEGVNVNAVMNDDLTALMLASYGGHIDVVERLINAGANPNAAHSSGATALYFATQENNSDCVKLLINAGANLNAATTSDGATPLFIAAWKGYTDCLEILIQSGANLNAYRTLDGASPLGAAVARGNTEYVKALIEAEEHLNALD